MSQTDYTSLVARVQAAVEREIDNLEAMTREEGKAPPRSETPESRVRRLASLSRTLRELQTLNAVRPDEPESEDDDALPRDIDALRQALCERLERLVARDNPGIHRDAEER